MFRKYEEALNWIHSRLKLGVKPGLKRMEWIMERLDHPEKKLKTVHIGGTNGKGSTVTFLRSILQQSGYEVGTFTSPYIEQFNERISINGKPIKDEELLKLTNDLYPLVIEMDKSELGGPTEFEIITAMAMYYFAEIHPVDIVIFEVGLGGRFDSTNIIHPLVSIITNIGLDHTSILGNTYKQIAYEKAGIIKKGIKTITAVKQDDAFQVIEEKADKMEATLFRLNEDFQIVNHESIDCGEEFSIHSSFGNVDNVIIRMVGQHQTENASLAVVAALILNKYYSFNIDETQMKEGLLNSYWPGRFEVIHKSPLVIVDGAHNEEGITALVTELEKRYKQKNIHIIFTALGDKKLDAMIEKLDSIADEITFVSFNFPRAAKANELYQISRSINKQVNENWVEAISTEMKNITGDSVLIITGSLYFISEVKKYFHEKL